MKKDVEVKKLIKEGQKDIKGQRYRSALNNFLEAMEHDPENPEICYYLGITYTRMEKYSAAAQYLEKVISSELSYINKVHAQMILGYIYTLQEDYQKALDIFRDVVKAGFESAQAYAAIGYIMDRQGNFKEAVMNLYRAIEIDPDNANAHNSLGYIFAEANINLEEALEECKKAVSMDRENPAYLDSLGWVYYKMGKMSQAKSYLQKALKKVPDNREIKTHLQVVMQKMGAPGN